MSKGSAKWPRSSTLGELLLFLGRGFFLVDGHLLAKSAGRDAQPLGTYTCESRGMPAAGDTTFFL